MPLHCIQTQHEHNVGEQSEDTDISNTIYRHGFRDAFVMLSLLDVTTQQFGCNFQLLPKVGPCETKGLCHIFIYMSHVKSFVLHTYPPYPPNLMKS